jgi:molecular chaperone DnaK (HSP70)
MPRIGIDLGTTNTAVAMVYDDGAHVLPRSRPELIPSLVYFRWDAGKDDVVVGREAFNAGAEPRVVRSVKRLMGRTYQEAQREGSLKYFPPDSESVRLVRRGDTDLGLEVGESPARTRLFWPHEISGWILKEAKRHGEKSLQAVIDGAIITVPAYFRDPHRAATLDAAREAGLEVLGPVIDEPTAAALAFAPVVGFTPGEQVLVVDWGGGTFDVTVQMTRKAEWLQVAIAGDLILGGDDIDIALVEHVLERAGHPAGILKDDFNRWTLLETARETKEQLSARDEATFAPRSPIAHPDSGRPIPPLNRTIRRSDLDGILAPFLTRTTAILEECLAKPDVDRDGIRKVLLVGGSSRIPSFLKSLHRLLPAARLCDDVDPMEAVALGAAIYANDRPSIARICPYGYEIVGTDGDTTEVIAPDTPIPTPEHLHFGVPAQTRYAAQTLYRLTYRSFVPHGNGLRTLHDPKRLFARGMPPTAIGTNVDVELWLDEDKRLKARCHIAGRAGSYDLEGRQEADLELFGRVANDAFVGEALLEANQAVEGGLMPALRSAVEQAKAVLETRDRAVAEQVAVTLKELSQQFEDKEVAMLTAAMAPAQRAHEHVEGWAGFHETTLLPFFWPVLAPEDRDLALERLRSVRMMLRTHVPLGITQAQLDEMEEGLYCTPMGPAIKAYRTAALLGMPERLADRLRTLARKARDDYRRDNRGAFNDDIAQLQGAIVEANRAWRNWFEAAAVLDASPDLLIRRNERGRGD